MVNARQFRIPQYICADYVKELKNKQFVILDEGKEKNGDYGAYLVMKVQVVETGMIQDWTINKETNQNFAMVFGDDTAAWRGKTGVFMLGYSKTKKEIVIGTPLMQQVQSIMSQQQVVI